MLSGEVAPMMTDFQRDQRIPAQRRGVSVIVEVRTVLAISPDTWQVDWTETTQEPGSNAVREQWRALITLGVDGQIAANPEFAHWNPFGLFVRQMSWQKASI